MERPALKVDPDKASRLQLWARELNARVGYHKTLVAIANKNARTLWALLAKDVSYNSDAWKTYAKP